MRKIYSSFWAVLILFGCNGQNDHLSPQSSNYFDLKKYFIEEAARLAKKNPKIKKTVQINDSSETRLILISDWRKELGSFADAEITRASWRGLFRIQKSKKNITYTSKDEKIPVKEVVVTLRNDKINGVKIVIKNRNILYTSTDSLSYYPDSVYQLIKHQKIRFLSDKTYSVKGFF